MTKSTAREEFAERLEHPSSVEVAKDLIRSQVDWLDYVPEHEFTIAERAAIVKACREFYAVIRPLTEKYID